MCMDAHMPSHWDICGNSELAVRAKLAIKLHQGENPWRDVMRTTELWLLLFFRNAEIMLLGRVLLWSAPVCSSILSF